VNAWITALSIVAPVVTAFGGYLLAARNEEARDRRREKAGERFRRAAVAEKLDERKHAFQFDLLVEVQDSLQRLTRATAKVILQDLTTLKEQGQVFLLPAGLSDEAYEAGVTFGRLRVRLLDQRLRDDLDTFHALATRLELSVVVRNDLPAPEAIRLLDSALAELTNGYVAVNDALGALLRSELEWSPPLLPE
jgi:hypothetical protein